MTDMNQNQSVGSSSSSSMVIQASIDFSNARETRETERDSVFANPSGEKFMKSQDQQKKSERTHLIMDRKGKYSPTQRTCSGIISIQGVLTRLGQETERGSKKFMNSSQEKKESEKSNVQSSIWKRKRTQMAYSEIVTIQRNSAKLAQETETGSVFANSNGKKFMNSREKKESEKTHIQSSISERKRTQMAYSETVYVQGVSDKLAQETERDSVFANPFGKEFMNSQEHEEIEGTHVLDLIMSLNRNQSPTQRTDSEKISIPGVSEKLTLGNNESVIKKIRAPKQDFHNLSSQEKRIRSFRFYNGHDREEERLLGVSTELKLSENPWKIMKKLKLSDINGSARLLLGKDMVEKYILPHCDHETILRIESENGVKVSVWDCDTKTEHELVFRRWVHSSHSYVFNNEWSSQFVRRRGLKVGDEIGLFWDTINSRFCFRVLVLGTKNQPSKH